ncbi:MAG: hypothetical protein L6R38_004959 [Xanthoria sp. 2 TBL-2021]|nr:MAG: hypothetical protein L6R38_004959 [Xanthoria sp. 2 TBL-2021]
MGSIAEPEILKDLSKHSKKRKRNDEASGELQVDINAPEPPSKKALRKAKKVKTTATASAVTAIDPAADDAQNTDGVASPPKDKDATTEQAAASKRSEHGIWIGNLPYTVTKADLRTFFTKNTEISEESITRVHVPPPADPSSSYQKIKPQNKGFAYIDFSTPEAVAEALALSETLLMGRKVLIKDAHNFEGRPEKTKDGDTEDAAGTRPRPPGKPPNKRIFVGNLWFNTEKSDLEEHFAQCGEVLDVHIATFEDSGKCKGYAWITFAEIEAAEAAVRGYIMKKAVDEDEEDENGSEDGEPASSRQKSKKKKQRERKWWVNKVRGRQLRMEFAEDATVRYKKRFGKDAPARTNGQGASVEEEGTAPTNDAPTVDTTEAKPKLRQRDSDPPRRPPKKLDARNVKPGAALAAAPRQAGGIVAGQGKKITFD